MSSKIEKQVSAAFASIEGKYQSALAEQNVNSILLGQTATVQENNLNEVNLQLWQLFDPSQAISGSTVIALETTVQKVGDGIYFKKRGVPPNLVYKVKLYYKGSYFETIARPGDTLTAPFDYFTLLLIDPIDGNPLSWQYDQLSYNIIRSWQKYARCSFVVLQGQANYKDDVIDKEFAAFFLPCLNPTSRMDGAGVNVAYLSGSHADPAPENVHGFLLDPYGFKKLIIGLRQFGANDPSAGFAVITERKQKPRNRTDAFLGVRPDWVDADNTVLVPATPAFYGSSLSVALDVAASEDFYLKIYTLDGTETTEKDFYIDVLGIA
jgi:hypothetical protein